jgi:glycosyltransferase involved in cell wall biosynthesis
MHESPNSFSDISAPPQGAELRQGSHAVRGWVWPKPGGHFVDVRARIDGSFSPGIYGLPRPDIAAHFQTGRPFALAEFCIFVTLPPGPAEIVLEALDIEGCWSAFQTLNHRVIAAESPNKVARPAGGFLAHEFGRTLHTLLRSHQADPDTALPTLVRDFVAQIPQPRDLQQPSPPFHGHLNEPACISRRAFGRATLHGYLFHEALPITRVLATYDLQAWQTIPHQLPSADPAAYYPQFPHAAQCGLFGIIDIPSQLPEPTCLRLYAELADHSLHLCAVQRTLLYGGEEEKRPYPARSPLLFVRLVQLLTRQLTIAGIQLKQGPALRREIWLAWRQLWRLGASAPSRPAIPSSAAMPAPRRKLTGQLGAVLLATHNLDYEGAPLLFLEYARHLATHGGACLTVVSAKEGPLRAQFASLGATVMIADIGALTQAATPAAWRTAFKSLAARFNLRETNLVVANTLACYWAVHLAAQADRPSLLYIHESTTPAAFHATSTKQGMVPAVEAALGLATRVSFNTRHTSRYYEPFSRHTNFWLNPGWIDLAALDRHRDRHTPAALRVALGLPPGKRLVVNLGTVCERKGQHIFVRAVDLLWRRHPELAAGCEFWMIGGRNSAYDECMTDLITQLERVNLRLIPETPHAYDYLGAADLFVCSSFEESFPRVILEAMAMKVPVVSTSVHGIPEMVRHEQEALLVAPGDSSALAEGMARSLQDPRAAQTMATQARNRVATEYDSSFLLPVQAGLAQEVIALHHAIS